MHCLACITAGVVEVHSIEAVWLHACGTASIEIFKGREPQARAGALFGDETNSNARLRMKGREPQTSPGAVVWG